MTRDNFKEYGGYYGQGRFFGEGQYSIVKDSYDIEENW
jgi:hypothetical protein